MLAHFGTQLYYFTNDLANSTLVEDNILNTPAWSFVEANNILFGANGRRMQKWTGTKWQQWGIAAPTVAPQLGGTASLGTTFFFNTISRAAGVVTITFSVTPTVFLNVGDTLVVFNSSDASFNGSFKIASVVTAGEQYTYNNAGANGNAPGGTLVTLPSQSSQYAITGIARANGITTVTVAGGVAVNPGPSLTIAGASDASFNGTFPLLSSDGGTPGHITYVQPGLADLVGAAGGTITFGFTTTVGRKVVYAYQNSVTGHISNISPAITLPLGTNRIYYVYGAPSTDPQVDTIVWFATLDGGGDFFFDSQVTGASYTAASLVDQTPDAFLDLTRRGPLINNPPPQGTYVALAQGRIFVAGLVGAGSDVAYSGYEQIIIGRPEESFPSNNRLRLALGAESVVGLGVLHSGIVMFSNTGKMWMLRGAIEDITLSAPVAFSDVLEELPWTLGCLSHYTIVQTPYGLAWLAGDKTVQFWDGRSNPIDISPAVYPILRSITPGTELLCNASYFNWLERDWYALTCATNGSLTPNTIIFWALDASSSNIEVFVSSLTTNWLGVVSTSKLQRKLLMANAGRIAELPVRAVDQNGLVNDFVTYPPTSGNLRAYWRSGFFGNESPEQSKLFRWTRIVPDRSATAYQVQSRYVDDTFTIDAPRLAGPTQAKQARVPLNQRGFRVSIEVDFPETDVACNVLELQLAYIGTSQR